MGVALEHLEGLVAGDGGGFHGVEALLEDPRDAALVRATCLHRGRSC